MHKEISYNSSIIQLVFFSKNYHVIILGYLSIYLSLYLSIYLCLFIYVSLRLFISISVCFYLSIYLSIYVCSYFYLTLFLSIYLSIFISFYLILFLSIYLSISFSSNLSSSVCSYQSISVHIYLCLLLLIIFPRKGVEIELSVFSDKYFLAIVDLPFQYWGHFPRFCCIIIALCKAITTRYSQSGYTFAFSSCTQRNSPKKIFIDQHILKYFITFVFSSLS